MKEPDFLTLDVADVANAVPAGFQGSCLTHVEYPVNLGGVPVLVCKRQRKNTAANPMLRIDRYIPLMVTLC